MTAADLAVTAALHASVLAVVGGGTPATGELSGWQPYTPGDRCTALFDAPSSVRSRPRGGAAPGVGVRRGLTRVRGRECAYSLQPHPTVPMLDTGSERSARYLLDRYGLTSADRNLMLKGAGPTRRARAERSCA